MARPAKEKTPIGSENAVVPKKRGRPLKEGVRRGRGASAAAEGGGKPSTSSLPAAATTSNDRIGFMLVNGEEMASILGMSRRYLGTLVEEGKVTQLGSRQFLVSQVVKEYVASRVAGEAARHSTTTTRDDLNRQQAERVARKMMLEDRTIVKLEDAMDAMDSVVAIAVQAFNALAPMLSKTSADRQKVEDVISQVRNRLADAILETARALGEGGIDDPSDDETDDG